MNRSTPCHPTGASRLRGAVVACALAAILVPHSLKADPAFELSVRSERRSALYHANEEIPFTISLKHKDASPVPESVTLHWKLSADGCPPVREGDVTLVRGVATLPGRLDRPGFLQCLVTGSAGGEKLRALGGAAVDPEKIAPTQTMPDDFDAFWNAKKAELAKVPLDAKMTPVPWKDSRIEAFDIRANCIGVPVSGYFARPRGAKPKSLPAILSLHGAGVDSSWLGFAAEWATTVETPLLPP